LPSSRRYNAELEQETAIIKAIVIFGVISVLLILLICAVACCVCRIKSQMQEDEARVRRNSGPKVTRAEMIDLS
jgi:hypothetical protein